MILPAGRITKSYSYWITNCAVLNWNNSIYWIWISMYSTRFRCLSINKIATFQPYSTVPQILCLWSSLAHFGKFPFVNHKWRPSGWISHFFFFILNYIWSWTMKLSLMIVKWVLDWLAFWIIKLFTNVQTQ